MSAGELLGNLELKDPSQAEASSELFRSSFCSSPAYSTVVDAAVAVWIEARYDSNDHRPLSQLKMA